MRQVITALLFLIIAVLSVQISATALEPQKPADLPTDFKTWPYYMKESCALESNSFSILMYAKIDYEAKKAELVQINLANDSEYIYILYAKGQDVSSLDSTDVAHTYHPDGSGWQKFNMHDQNHRIKARTLIDKAYKKIFGMRVRELQDSCKSLYDKRNDFLKTIDLKF